MSYMRTPLDLPFERCTDGYLQNRDDWNEDVARQMASEWKGLQFTDEHLPVLYFIRDYHEKHQTTPDVREAAEFLMETMGMDKKAAKKHLFKLFPNGYMQQGIQLAGMRRPTAWCVG